MRWVALGIAFGVAAGACGLSIAGTATTDGGVVGAADASADTTVVGDGGGSVDGSSDGATSDAIADAAPIDAPPEATCVPFDAGLGALPLAGFTLKGNAAFNESNDGKITLTNSNNREHGAAWWPIALAPMNGYDATFGFRVGPGDTAGEGITFAIVASASVPGVGDDGDGLGLRNLAGADGGVASGYAVVVDMYKSASDPTDLDVTTLKIITMPSFTVIAKVGINRAYNDGNVYVASVSWRAPGSIDVTMQMPGGGIAQLSASDPGLAMVPPSYAGFTGATGGAADSHQEIASLAFTATCE
jgi:hypothetical protein